MQYHHQFCFKHQYLPIIPALWSAETTFKRTSFKIFFLFFISCFCIVFKQQLVYLVFHKQAIVNTVRNISNIISTERERLTNGLLYNHFTKLIIHGIVEYLQ